MRIDFLGEGRVAGLSGQNASPRILTDLNWLGYNHRSALPPIYGNRNSKKHWPPITGALERSWGPYGRGPGEDIRITGPAIPALAHRTPCHTSNCPLPQPPTRRRRFQPLPSKPSHNEIWSSRAFRRGPQRIRESSGWTHPGAKSGGCEAAPARKLVRGNPEAEASEDGVALRISADSARSGPSSGPSVQVHAALATFPPSAPSPLPPRPVLPALGANRRLFPFNGPGPAPALPPAPLPHPRLICQSLPQPKSANPLHPGLGQRPWQSSVHPRFRVKKGAPGAPGGRAPRDAGPAPTPGRGRQGGWVTSST